MPASKPSANAASRASASDAAKPKARMQAVLFDAEGNDRGIDPCAISPSGLGERQLLWVDVEDDDGHGAMIAANQVGIAGSGFEGDDNTLTVFDVEGEAGHTLGPAPKTQLADELLDLVAARLRATT